MAAFIRSLGNDGNVKITCVREMFWVDDQGCLLQHGLVLGVLSEHNLALQVGKRFVGTELRRLHRN